MMENISIEQLNKKFPQLENITKLKTGGQKVVYDAVHARCGWSSQGVWKQHGGSCYAVDWGED